jgi:hypothetical protein
VAGQTTSRWHAATRPATHKRADIVQVGGNGSFVRPTLLYGFNGADTGPVALVRMRMSGYTGRDLAR